MFIKRILYLIPSAMAGVLLTLALVLFLDVQNTQAATFTAVTLTVDTLLDGAQLEPTKTLSSQPDVPSGNNASPVFAASNDVLHIAALTPEGWREVGTLAYDRHLREQRLALPRPSNSDFLVVRVTHTGATAAHVDAALLDGAAPLHVYGAAEETALALHKLAAREYDVVDIEGRTLTLVFAAQQGGTLALTARIEPERITQTPFQFPLTNLYQTMTPDAAFYSYEWDSQPGTLTVDGDLADEGLGTPFFKEFSQTGTGHPSADTYGWVRNDSDTLYVAIDFVPDNTMDGDKDYTTVYINTPTGLRAFKASVPDQTWGMPGFTYTPRAVYQHKVYEFAIPLIELGLDALAPGDELPLAFAAYGTAAPPNPYPGPWDVTFDDDGIVYTNIGNNGISDAAKAVAIQDNGKIVVVGHEREPSNENFALVRYTLDGTLDTTFGSGGVITTDLTVNSRDYGNAVAIQPDGKIVVAGTSDSRFALVRYASNGDLDTGFGSGGVVTTSIAGSTSNGLHALELQEDGKLLVAGYTQSGTTSTNNFILLRYTISGTLDTSFGSTGIITTDIDGDADIAYALAMQDDGKIVVAGTGRLPDGYDVIVARYMPTGALDATFGNSRHRGYGCERRRAG